MRYPNAFEDWYKKQVKEKSNEFDEMIIKWRDSGDVDSLANGERQLRKMLYIEWKIDTGVLK